MLSSMCQQVATLQFVSCAEKDKAFFRTASLFSTKRIFDDFAEA